MLITAKLPDLVLIFRFLVVFFSFMPYNNYGLGVPGRRSVSEGSPGLSFFRGILFAPRRLIPHSDQS